MQLGNSNIELNQFGYWIFTDSTSPIRFFKKRLERSPHKFYLQQLMLFYPFRDEAELFPDDEEKCIALYLKN